MEESHHTLTKKATCICITQIFSMATVTIIPRINPSLLAGLCYTIHMKIVANQSENERDKQQLLLDPLHLPNNSSLFYVSFVPGSPPGKGMRG